jgi:predicted metal-dependent phosphotriesterase family hydrolase
MSFVRTVLGDIDPADLGPTYAHEHLIIDGGRLVELQADFRLDSVDKGVAELEEARELGLRAVVDALPCDAGRNVRKLADISRRSGVHVLAPTGLHLARYYEDGHWSVTATEGELARLFEADVLEGIDENDYTGPIVHRTEHRAGFVKVAGSGGSLIDRDRRVFRAAAAVHRATGCPILTHCTDGTAGIEQLRLLADEGADLGHVVLSHTDKVVDRGYHREMLSTGAAVEYDQSFRWPEGAENGTLTLLEWMVADGYASQLMLGMDAARRSYWTAYGGRPGLGHLLGAFSDEMANHGLDAAVLHAIFVENPARVLAFARPAADARPRPTERRDG